jgi:hypothetical protein
VIRAKDRVLLFNDIRCSLGCSPMFK